MLNEKDFYKQLSILIKTKRKDLNLTNESLFMSSGVDLSKISLLQNNKTGCNAYTLYKILFTLNIDIFNINNINKNTLDQNINKLSDVSLFLKKLK